MRSGVRRSDQESGEWIWDWIDSVEEVIKNREQMNR